MLQDIRFFRAIGIVIALITLKLLVPDLWQAGDAVLLQFLSTLQRTLAFTPGEILQSNVISVPQIPH